MSEWLSELPPTWRIANPRRHFRDRREVARSDDAHLTPSQHMGVLTQTDYMQRTGSRVVLNLSAPDNMKHVEPGDFIAHLRSFQGGLEHSGLRGKVSTAYTVIAPHDSVHGPFYRWVLKSTPFISALSASLEQLRDGQSVKFEDFASIPLPLPPQSEQRRIADFLDDRVARIDQIIIARRAQIDAIHQWRAHSLETVLGRIPQTSRASRVVRVLPGFAFPSTEYTSTETDRRLLRGVNLTVGSTRWDEVVYWPESRVEEVRDFVLQPGDLVLGMDRPWVGNGLRIARVTEDDERPLLLQRVAKISSSTLTNDFMFWAYQSRRFRDQVESDLTGLSVPHLSGDQIGSFEIPVCGFQEQAEVVAAMDAEEQAITETLRKIDSSIELMREYKQSLITAAVTGQLDVTTAGSDIPG